MQMLDADFLPASPREQVQRLDYLRMGDGARPDGLPNRRLAFRIPKVRGAKPDQGVWYEVIPSYFALYFMMLAYFPKLFLDKQL